MLAINRIYLGDCLDLMKNIDDKSIDMVLSDLPYAITSCEWDVALPLELLWKEYWRIVKGNGVIALTASQPFSSILVMSNLKMFIHEWIWIKNRGSNFANTVREPFKEHEHVLIFSRGNWSYNKQMQERTGAGSDRVNYNFNFRTKSKNYRAFSDKTNIKLSKLRGPSSWQKFNTDTSGLHPTIKPVNLFEYLIKTYTNEGDLVLDNCAGSCTTAVAAENLKRKWICIEKEREYCLIGRKRILENRKRLSEL